MKPVSTTKPPAQNDLEISWHRMWSGLGLSEGGSEARNVLLARYSEPWRKYHTLQHLRECVAIFESVACLAEPFAEVEAGLWFHDAVYDPRRNDNEQRSATLARSLLAAGGMASEVCGRVDGLILATTHTTMPVGPDQQLLVDIDLSILGAEESRFAEFERQIRDEYAFVAEPVFREKRRAILRSFLERTRIYGTPYFLNRFE
jgi:predicted metal-dependent HD superfamily phosphohydrolase